jgi:redox-sensitive bicupin YhaK (pirin superfamily)
VTIHADARLYAGLFDGAETAELDLAPGRLAYVHLVRGSLTVNGQDLTAGDALQIKQTSRVAIQAGRDAEVLVFDLAA